MMTRWLVLLSLCLVSVALAENISGDPEELSPRMIMIRDGASPDDLSTANNGNANALLDGSITTSTASPRISIRGHEGQRGFVTLFLDGTGIYRAPKHCTGEALVEMLKALQPHLFHSEDRTVFLAINRSPADGMRLAADAMEAKDRLITASRALLTHCEKGE
jgi:hypothetical protein